MVEHSTARLQNNTRIALELNLNEQIYCSRVLLMHKLIGLDSCISFKKHL